MELLSYMNALWKSNNNNDESFWEHEWNKHVSSPQTRSGRVVRSLADIQVGGGIVGNLSFHLGAQVFQHRKLCLFR